MGYKSILTVVTDPNNANPTIRVASALCRHHDAHLNILALGVDRLQVGDASFGVSAAVMQVALEQVEDHVRSLDTVVRRAMAGEPHTLRWNLETTVTQRGALTDLVAQTARYADLVVLPAPYRAQIGRDAEAVIEGVLFEGRAPVLVLPDAGLDPLPIENIVIGWNQSHEALAAIRHAMPFLLAAKIVNIAIIDPPIHGRERADPGGALCQMLARYGVKAEVSVLVRTLPRIADVLHRHVVDQGAGLMVMGAYGHSRLREAIMGGATRSMLEQATVPLLMAH